MAELKKIDVDRLALSEQVITTWEAIGGPGGTPVDNLRLIDAEIAILGKLRAGDDDERISSLIARYEAMAARLRASIN